MNLRRLRWGVGLIGDLKLGLQSNLGLSPVHFKEALGEAQGLGSWHDAKRQGCRPSNGRSAVVTGGTRGVGREVCLGLAARGWDVTATGRDVAAGAALEAEVQSRGGRLKFAQLDFAGGPGRIAELAQNYDSAHDRPLDLLVNNAGAMGKNVRRTP